MSRLFAPTARQMAVLLVILVLTAGCAFWLRLSILEDRAISLSCREGLGNWLCLFRDVATFTYENSVLGTVAVLLAAANLVRPSYVMFATAAVAAAIAAVLYNVGGAAIAITLLILSLARRERETI